MNEENSQSALPYKIHCGYSELKSVGSLIPHPKNARRHPGAQIERLAKLLKFYGFRKPIIVSAESGFIVAGHAKAQAATLNGWATVPVETQSFESPEMELGFLVADNAISEFEGAETDLGAVNAMLQDFDGANGFDLDLLGLESFELDPEPVPEDTERKSKACPQCGYALK